MTEATQVKNKRFNALDFTIVLLVFLIVLGIAGRIILDRYHSSGMETRTVAVTFVVEKEDANQFDVGSVFKDSMGNKIGTIVQITETTVFSQTEKELTNEYHRVTANMTVRGYQANDGVFYSASGLCLRLNTTVTVYSGIEMQLYINDIVENGQ